MITKIYDTSSLLLIEDFDKLFNNPEERVVITSITLHELEQIKISTNKDPSIKYAARQLLAALNNCNNHVTTILYTTNLEEWILKNNLELNNDSKILAAAYNYQAYRSSDCVFITNDSSLLQLARAFLNMPAEKLDIISDDYTGVLELTLSDDEMAEFYSSDGLSYNHKLNAYINQYVNIYNSDHECVDTVCWDGYDFRPLKYKSFYSEQLGEIKPYKGDIYQAMVADSLLHNKLTMIKGPAGAGKTHLALGYLFFELEHNKIDRIIIFCNTIATKNSAKLGFYPGTRDEKLLDSQIGNLLSQGEYV